MPLPPSGAVWPPEPLQPVFQQQAIWSSWYAGDPDELARVYGGMRDTVRNRPSQFRGGVIGALSRMFWGRPIPQGEPQQKLHVPLAGDIAAKSADLLFSEPPTFDFDGNTAAAEFIENATNEGGLYAALLEGAETGGGLGGYYLKTVWDDEVAPEPWIVAAHHDAAVPEWAWGRLRAVTFWETVEADDDTVIRHLERHERGERGKPGAIHHGLYEGNTSHLGSRIDLGAHDRTRGLAGIDSGDNVLTVPTGIPMLTASYVPNMTPNRLWRGIPEAQPLGRSDYAGAEGFMDALDETWTSWMRDIRLAKGRVFVPAAFLESMGAGRGAEWSADREIYAALNMLPDPSSAQLTINQFAIRVAEHEATANALTATILRSARYSPKSFGMDSGGQAVTATEIRTGERQSFITQARKAMYTRAPLASIVEALLAVNRAQFNGKAEPARPSITFADSVSEAPETVAQTLQMLEAAGAISTYLKVRMQYPEWTDAEIGEEVDRIRSENGAATADPETFTRRIGEGAAVGALDEDVEVDGEDPRE